MKPQTQVATSYMITMFDSWRHGKRHPKFLVAMISVVLSLYYNAYRILPIGRLLVFMLYLNGVRFYWLLL